MGEIQRYGFSRCKLHFEPHVCMCGPLERKDGEYVKHTDHLAEIERLKAENAEFERNFSKRESHWIGENAQQAAEIAQLAEHIAAQNVEIAQFKERIRELQRSNQAIESALHSKEEHAAWRRYFMAACEIYADEQAKRASLVAMLRKEWWFNHGCGSIVHLYGDDGEMQCNNCFTDFRRTPFEELEQRVDGLRLAALGRQNEPAA